MNILYVNFTMNMGGIETFLMNIIRNFDLKNNRISFLCYNNCKFDYEEEITKFGCDIFRISNPKNISVFKHFIELYRIIKKGNYNVVHCNTYFDSAYVMLAAKLANVKVRITHSHTSEGSNPKNFKQLLKWDVSRLLINCFSTKKIACSDLAGTALFKKSKFEILENGIEINKFKFNKKIRDELRKKYNVCDDQIVIGHVGRFVNVKNHKFIIEIFKKMILLNPNYRLLLIGDGPEYNNIINLINKYDLNNYIIMTKSVNNAYDFYNMMDILLFPSIYEGLPVTLIEAQVNGLKIIASDTISKSSNIIDNITFLSLNNDVEIWCNNILKNKKRRNDNYKYFECSCYNINNTIKRLIKIYKKN